MLRLKKKPVYISSIFETSKNTNKSSSQRPLVTRLSLNDSGDQAFRRGGTCGFGSHGSEDPNEDNTLSGFSGFNQRISSCDWKQMPQEAVVEEFVDVEKLARLMWLVRLWLPPSRKVDVAPLSPPSLRSHALIALQTRVALERGI